MSKPIRNNRSPNSTDHSQAGPEANSAPDRRDFVRYSSAAVAAGLILPSATVLAGGTRHQASEGSAFKEYTLPDLPYAFDALDPVIDTQTMEIHHGKHHQGYVNKLNKALADHADLAAKPVNELLADLDSVPEEIRTAVRNNGGGHSNHTLFWTVMRAARENNMPSGKLADAINGTFESFEKFQDAFNTAAGTRFGSGWAWLVHNGSALEVMSTANQDTPISEGKTPVLGLDVWEHAYYLNYQNRRGDYVKHWWSLVNWDQVSKNFAAAG